MDSQDNLLPLLVLVSGPPGSGKTTLAQRLSETLRLPLLAKDMFKDILADAVGVQSLSESQALGVPAYRVLYAVMAQLLSNGVSMIVDANFYSGVSEDDLHPLARSVRTVLLHCYTPPETAVRRYLERYHRGKRHSCHFDGERVRPAQPAEEAFSRSQYEPMTLGVPTLCVDTTDGYHPDFETIVGFVRTAKLIPAG